MLEYAQTALYGQFTEERMWGLVLLALSTATAAIPMFAVAGQFSGYVAWGVAAAVFFPVWVAAAWVWGKPLSWVRQRWFA